MVSLLLDGLVAVLLVATIAYAALLNRRFGTLREGKEELREIVNSFDAAMTRIETGLGKLKQVGNPTSGELKELVAEARTLRDELSFLLDRGGALASRLEKSTKARSRNANGRPRPAPEGGYRPRQGAGSEASEAAQELLAALRSTR
jgi:hypothetical protein